MHCFGLIIVMFVVNGWNLNSPALVYVGGKLKLPIPHHARPCSELLKPLMFPLKGGNLYAKENIYNQGLRRKGVHQSHGKEAETSTIQR